MIEIRNKPFEAFQRRILVAIACMYVCRGFQQGLEPEKVIPDWAIIHTLIPNKVSVTLWFTTAAIAVACALFGKTEYGFGAVMIMPVERAVSYLWSFVMWALPGGPGGHLASLAWAGWWLSLLGLFFLIAGWPAIELSRAERKEKQCNLSSMFSKHHQ